jgi:hypothetical protein
MKLQQMSARANGAHLPVGLLTRVGNARRRKVSGVADNRKSGVFHQHPVRSTIQIG